MEQTRVVHRHFDSVAATWERHYVGNGGMKSRLDRFARQLSPRVPTSAEILDFGCGSGDVSAHLAAMGYCVTGVDASQAMIARSSERFTNPNLRFLCCGNLSANGFQLPFPKGAFQACIASSVLEYLLPLDSYLRELRRVTAAGGSLVVTVPNALHPLRLVEYLERKLLYGIYSKPSFAKRPRCGYLLSSVNRFSMSKWRTALLESGWLVESAGGWRDPLLLISCRAA